MNKRLINCLLKLITGYQRWLSPDHGGGRLIFPHGVCRYRPTCSQYMSQAIQHYGWYGIVLGMKRILRCHPWARGGHDPLSL